MLDLPKPKLGEVSAITIASPDLEKSFEFYQSIGFHELFRSDFPFPLIQISDGALMIMLRKDPNPYIALTYYVKNIDDMARQLEGGGIEFTSKPKPGDMVKRYLMQSPDGMNVSLVSFVDGFEQPKGPTMLRMPPADYMNPDKYVNKIAGLFGEFACPVTDIDQSMVFWEKLGFKILSRMQKPYDWAIISDGLNVVGLHQTTHFQKPTLTFFSKDSKNTTLTTPENQHINLFKFGF